jgi:hypothetical protein
MKRRGSRNKFRGSGKPQNSRRTATIDKSALSGFGSMEIGTPNVTRNFSVDQNFNGPQIIFRKSTDAFTSGWKNNDDFTGTGISGSYDNPSTVTFYPYTPIAQAFDKEYWPAIQTMLSSGLGSRYTPTHTEVLLYLGHVTSAYQKLLTVMAIHHASNGMDWSVLPPNTPSVPSFLYEAALNLDATNVGMADRWRPYIDRISQHILPTKYAAKLAVDHMPRVATAFGQQIQISSAFIDEYYSPTAADNLESDIRTHLDFIDNKLASTSNVLRTFIPWRIGDIPMGTISWSPEFAAVNYNSGIEDQGAVQGGTVPNYDAIVVGDNSNNGSQGVFYHLGNRATVAELVNTSVFEAFTDSVNGDKTRLLTLTNHSKYMLVADNGVDVVMYDSSTTDGATAIRYASYCPNRFRMDEPNVGVITPPDQGRGSVPYLTSTFTLDQIIRLTEQYFLDLFSLATVQTVSRATAGASLRTASLTVSKLWGMHN